MRIPRYDEPQVTPNALPTVRQNANDYNQGAKQLGDLAQAAGQAGDDLNRAATRLQDRDDADNLFRAEAAVVGEYQQDFEAKARERRGHKAIGLSKEAAAWWDKAASKYTEGLTTERQKRLFNNKLTTLRGSSVDAMSTYESGQRRASLEDSTKAGIVADINLAASNPAAVDASRTSIRQRVRILADLNGDEEETRKGRESEALTQLHAQVLQGLLDKNPTEAKAYFEANKAEIEGSKHAEIEGKLKSGTLRTLAQTAADELAGMGSEAEAIAKARKTYSGDEEQAVVEEIKTRFNERDQARQSHERNTADRAWKVYADAGYQKSAIPNSLWSELDGRTKIAIDADYGERLSGTNVKTDWNTYDKLRTMARERPAEFLREDLRQYASRLGKSERETLTDIKDKLTKGDDVATLEQQLAAVHRQMEWGEGDADKRGQFDTLIHRALNEEQKAAGGKTLNFEERQKVIDRMLIEKSSVFGGRFYEVYGTEDQKDFVFEIKSDAEYDALPSGAVFVDPDGKRRRKP